MDSLLQSLQARILPEDVALLADGNGIKALSVNEVLAITHAIDHQLSMMKRGVLGSDIVGFVQHLLSTGELDPNTFPRSPTPIELQLCRKLARIEDSDIVTQLQILRMLDVFRILVVLFQRNVLSMIEDELGSNNNNGNKSSSNKPSGGKNNKRSIGGGARTSSAQKRHVSQQSNAIPEDVAARIDLATDVCASAAALTDDTLFATSYGGMIPTYVLYQVAERYGLDARSCFHPHSAISMLPTSDDAVLALRDIKAREDEQKRRLAAGNGKKSSSPRGDAKHHSGGSDGSDDDALGDETLNSTTGGTAVASAAAAAEQQRRKASTTLQKNTVVPVEFISPVVLTDTFTPLDKKLLRVFTETFGAYDPNDPHNQFGLSEDLVDGHYLRILPIPKFAHVLRISLMRATKVIQHALEGVAAGATGRGAGGALGTVGSASVRRRSQRHGNDAISTGGDDVEDLFGVWGSDAAAANGGSTGSVGQRSLSPVPGHILGGKKMSFVSEAAMSARSPPPPAGVNANNNSNTLANSQRGNNNHDNNTNSVAAEALPSPFHVVIARGYLRYPEFELIIRFLNQDASASSDQASGLKEAQQYLVDELVARNSNTQLASGKGASSLTSAASPQQSEQARQLGAAASRQRGVFAPSGEDEQRLIDGQATFIERMLFAPDGTLKLVVNTANGGLSTAGGASARKSGKFVRGGGAADIVSPTNGGDEERRFPGGAPDASGAALVVSPTSGSSPADGDAGATAASAGIGGGEKRHSTVTVNLQRSHRASHHRHGSPSSPTGSIATTSGAPLHGWAIHEHPADRLATNPMNGRDVNRMRKSFVSSSDRTTHSYTNSNTATGQLQQTLDAAPASSGGGAAGGPIGAPNSGAISSTQVAQPMQRRVVSPRQRQLMEVLNLEKMAEVMDRIPDDPLGLFAGSLLGGGVGTAGSGVGGVGVGGVQQGANNGGTNAGGPQSLLSPSGIGGASGAGGGAPSHLSIAALLNHTDSSLAAAYFGGPGGNGSLSTGGGAYALEVDLLDPSGSSKRSGGTRSGTKASCKNPSHGEGGGGMLVSPTLLGASSRHQRLLSSSGQGDDDLSISQNPYDVTVSAPDAAVLVHPAGDGSAPLSGGAGAANGGAPADGTARTRTHNKVPLRSTGIHERDWRSVHYIPKLDNDSIGDYCHNTKRSGGGFGERGRPTAPTGAEGGGDAASTSSRRQRRQYPKSDSGHAAPKVSAEDDSVVPGGQQSHGNPTDKRSSPVSSRSTRDNNSQTQAKPQQLDTSGGGNQQPSPTHVRKVPKKPLPLASPRTAAATRDPDAEVKHMPRAPAPPPPRRLHDGPSSSRAVPVEPSSLTANTTKAKSARQAAPSSQSVVPPPRGFMAVMDASRQPHGGTMLSFIPSALAMDVVRSIDLRHTLPNAGGGGRHSVRGSLLEPLGQGNRGAAEPLEAVRDPLHDAAMARSREQMGKLRYAS